MGGHVCSTLRTQRDAMISDAPPLPLAPPRTKVAHMQVHTHAGIKGRLCQYGSFMILRQKS